MGLKKTTLIYGVALVLERLVSFLIVPILTRNLPAELYGVWTQITVTMSLITGLVLLNLQTAFINIFAGRNEHDRWLVIHRLLFAGIVACLSIGAAMYLFSAPVADALFGQRELAKYVVFFGLLLTVEASYELLTAYLRSAEKIVPLSCYYLVRYCGRTLALFTCLSLLHAGLDTAFTVLVAVFFALNLFMYFRHIAFASGRASWRELLTFAMPWRELLAVGLPLTPISLFTWLGNFSDRYWIIHSVGAKPLATYAVTSSLAAALALFYTAIGFTFFPRLAHLMNTGETEAVTKLFPKVLSVYLALAIPAVAGLSLLSEPLCRLLSTREYVSSPLLMFFMTSGICSFGVYQLCVYVLLTGRRLYSNLGLIASTSILNFTLNALLVPRMGILGAGTASFVSNSALGITGLILAHSVLHFRMPFRFLSGLALRTALMGVVVYVGQRWLPPVGVRQVAVLIVLGAATYLVLDSLNKSSLYRQLRGTLA